MSDDKKNIRPDASNVLKKALEEAGRSQKIMSETMASLGAARDLARVVNAANPALEILQRYNESHKKTFDSINSLLSNSSYLNISNQLRQLQGQQFELSKAFTASMSHTRVNISRWLNDYAKQSSDSREMMARYAAFFENYKSSYLYNFLSNSSSSYAEQLARLEEEIGRNFGALDVAEVAVEAVPRQDLEREIVEALQSNKNISELSSEALRYFKVFWEVLWDFLEKATIIIALTAALQGSSDSLTSAQSPIEIRQSVKHLTVEQREFLKGYSIVTRDDVIVRAGAGKSFVELLRLPAKTRVENLGDDVPGWIHISLIVGEEEVEGWISDRYLLVY